MAKSGTETISLAEVRDRVVRAQGYASRPRSGTAGEVLATIRRLACVQLDSISTVERSHRIALGARVGAYPEAAVARLMREGKIFEYWAHEACLVPVEDFRLHRWRMREYAESHPWHGNVLDRDPELTQHVLDELAEKGPLPSRHFEGKGSGGMWNWKPAKVVLEALHSSGRVVIAGRESFQRLYALPETILPRELLDGEPPTRDEFARWATLRAVARAWRPHREGRRRDVAAEGRRRRHPAARRPLVDAASCAASRSTTAGRRSSSRARSRPARCRRPSSSRRSTTSSGIATSSRASSASGT